VPLSSCVVRPEPVKESGKSVPRPDFSLITCVHDPLSITLDAGGVREGREEGVGGSGASRTLPNAPFPTDRKR
jgi:hypothetical protein